MHTHAPLQHARTDRTHACARGIPHKLANPRARVYIRSPHIHNPFHPNAHPPRRPSTPTLTCACPHARAHTHPYFPHPLTHPPTHPHTPHRTHHSTSLTKGSPPRRRIQLQLPVTVAQILRTLVRTGGRPQAMMSLRPRLRTRPRRLYKTDHGSNPHTPTHTETRSERLHFGSGNQCIEG